MLDEARNAYRETLHNEAEAKAANPEGGEAVKSATEAVKRERPICLTPISHAGPPG